jgi:hypothetical protein
VIGERVIFLTNGPGIFEPWIAEEAADTRRLLRAVLCSSGVRDLLA